MGKLPKDVAIRVSTKYNKKNMPTVNFEYKNSASSLSLSENESLLSTISTTPAEVLYHTEYQTTVSDKIENKNELTEEIVELLKDLVAIKKMDGYQQGKIDAYETLLHKIDSCSTIPEFYKVINQIREELSYLLSK